MGMQRHPVSAGIRAFRKHYATLNNTLASPIISVASLHVRLKADCYFFVTLTIVSEPKKKKNVTSSWSNQMQWMTDVLPW